LRFVLAANEPAPQAAGDVSAICELNRWQQVVPKAKSIDLRSLGDACAAVALPADIPVRISVEADSNPTYATVVGKLVLGPPHEGPLSIRIRGDAAFVLNGNIVPR